MIPAALGMVVVFASMQVGWVSRAADHQAGGAKTAASLIEIAVTNSTEPKASHADDLRASAEHMLRGNFHLENGDYEAALAEYTKALEYDPKSWVAVTEIWYYLYQVIPAGHQRSRQDN